jgi:hypothetical protein
MKSTGQCVESVAGAFLERVEPREVIRATRGNAIVALPILRRRDGLTPRIPVGACSDAVSDGGSTASNPCKTGHSRPSPFGEREPGPHLGNGTERVRLRQAADRVSSAGIEVRKVERYLGTRGAWPQLAKALPAGSIQTECQRRVVTRTQHGEGRKREG